MSLPDFIKDNKQNEDKTSEKKDGFSEKCQDILAKIKKLDQVKHDELSKTFQSQYCGPNVQKKKLIGFYGQLVSELKILEERNNKGLLIPKTPIKSSPPPKKSKFPRPY